MCYFVPIRRIFVSMREMLEEIKRANNNLVGNKKSLRIRTDNREKWAFSSNLRDAN